MNTWLELYVLLVAFHYPGMGYLFLFSPVPGWLGIRRCTGKLCLWLVVWLGTGLLFNGCIFSHAQQYCLWKAGMIPNASYCLQDSLAYKLVWKFLPTRPTQQKP